MSPVPSDRSNLRRRPPPPTTFLARPGAFVLAGLAFASALLGAPASDDTPLDADPSKAKLFVGMAQGNYLAGDLAGAERAVAEALKADPDHARALSLQARVKLDLDEPKAALDAIGRALEAAPGDAENRLLRALILVRLDRVGEAADVARSVRESSDEGGRIWRSAQQSLGLIRMRQGDWDAAARIFRRLHQGDPEGRPLGLILASEAMAEKARRASGSGDIDAALEAIEAALETLDGESGANVPGERKRLRLHKGRLLARAGERGRAIRLFERLLERHPGSLEALLALASLRAATGDWAALETLTERLPDEERIDDIERYFRGRVALGRGRSAKALERFDAALAEPGDDGRQALRPDARFYRGLALARLGRENDARETMLAARDAGFAPRTEEAALALARALLAAGRPADAVPILERIALRGGSANPELWATLGRALARTSKPNEARPAVALSAFDRALELDPQRPATLALRASMKRRLGDLEGALADYRKAVELDPDNHPARFALAIVCLQTGRVPAAEKHLGRLDPEQAPRLAGTLRALSAYALGDLEEARAAVARRLAGQGAPAPEIARLDYLLRRRSGDAPPGGEDASPAPFRGLRGDDGSAASPEAAFWLAQLARLEGEAERTLQLLKRATREPRPDAVDYHLAQWQLARFRQAAR